jgi:hypothetical protein
MSNQLTRPSIPTQLLLYSVHPFLHVLTILGNSPQVLEDAENPDCKILMEKRVLLDLLERKADAFALAGRGKTGEKRPIDFEIYDKERVEEIPTTPSFLGILTSILAEIYWPIELVA